MSRCVQCDYKGDDLAEHAVESGHRLCAVCRRRSLTEFESQTCPDCIVQIRSDILDILDGYASLPPVIAGTALHPGTLPGGDALVLSGDGSLESPQTPNAYTEPHEVAPTVHLEHPELPGEKVTLPAYVESRIPSDRREHVRDHWTGDPTPVLAVLEANERDWRRTYGEGPADDLATVTGCAGYLLRNLEGGHNAAQTHPAIDEFASELRTLRSRVTHVAGLANDPVVAPIACSCHGRLERAYREIIGLADDWTCTSCGETYSEAAYMLRLRVLTDQPGWVSVEAAARAVARPVATVWAWMRMQSIPAACNRITRRTVVDLEAVQARSDEVGRVSRRSA